MATAAAVAESRGDLLAWLNDLLQLNISKIEHVGTGAPICQIFDSIFGDVPLHKCKFNTHFEHEYILNYKVLQSIFDKHGIDKYIPVDRLIKLKFQDNLEFLQWVKKYWDANYPGGSYDAIGRRGGKPVSGGMTKQAPPPPSPKTDSKTASRSKVVTNSSPKSASSVVTSSTNQKNQQANIELLQNSITQLNLTIDEMERERDFYFGKLRDIEIVTQTITDPGLLGSELFKRITEILYKTEEGFEIPTNE